MSVKRNPKSLACAASPNISINLHLKWLLTVNLLHQITLMLSHALAPTHFRSTLRQVVCFTALPKADLVNVCRLNLCWQDRGPNIPVHESGRRQQISEEEEEEESSLTQRY